VTARTLLDGTGRPPLLLLGLATFASMASMRACDSLLPLLAVEFGTTTGAAAQTISAFAIAYGLLQIVFGPLSDRVGRLRLITFAVVCCAVANLAVAVSPNLRATVGWRAFAGAASGGIVPLALALIGDTVAYERRQEVLARLMFATLSGMIAGQWLGGVAADAFGWRAVFGGLSLGFAAVAVALITSGHAGPGSGPAMDARGIGFMAGVLRVLQVRWARWIVSAAAIEGAFAFAALTFVPSHLHHDFGLSLGQAGAVMALYGVGGLAYAAGARQLVGRLGERGLVVAGGCCLGLAMAMLAFGPTWHWAVPACFVGGVGFQMLHITLQAHATQMEPSLRGTAVSLFVVCLFAGQAIGVSTAGVVVDAFSPRWVFAASMVALPLMGLWLHRGLVLRRQWPARQGGAARTAG